MTKDPLLSRRRKLLLRYASIQFRTALYYLNRPERAIKRSDGFYLVGHDNGTYYICGISHIGKGKRTEERKDIPVKASKPLDGVRRFIEENNLSIDINDVNAMGHIVY